MGTFHQKFHPVLVPHLIKTDRTCFSKCFTKSRGYCWHPFAETFQV